MFPQSELDNYKLQVELLQEKLQRSEISRQQLEHNLEKILLKRDEHDKVLRLKSKQKYQQFLDEQQRRNERNKQLVQMLERIEQQTAAMNARSERLKMMKLQYEMYFAKLVHSQTRRCIQSSAAAGTTTAPIMGATALPRPVGQTMMMPTAASMEGFNYTNVYAEPPLIASTYSSFPDTAINRDHFLHAPHRDLTIAETPLSDYTINSERNDYLEMRKPDPYQQLRQHRYDANVTIRDLDERKAQFNDSMPATREQIFYNNTQELKENREFPPTTSLLDKNKETLDLLDMPTTVSSSSAALTFDRIPNAKISSTTTSSFKESIINDSNILAGGINRNLEQQKLNEISPKLKQHFQPGRDDRRSMDSSISELSLNSNKDIQPNYENFERKNETRQQPQMHMSDTAEVNINPVSRYEIQPEQQRVEISELKSGEMEIRHLPATTNENSPAPSSATPVSLENIENAIYGELVNPLEETQQKQDKPPRVGPELLENLVTQPQEIGESTVANLEPIENDQAQHVTESNTTSFKNETSTENTQLPADNQNYEQAYDYNTPATNISADDGQNNANVDYTDYEMNNKQLIDENQQDQQYDYTNYDPSQYSYPGYIYDETTGEYKPDPNAPAEQYAIDQQYAQGYDQQYQPEGYDYNQAYEQQQQQQDQQPSEIDPAAYAEYDAAQQLEQQPTTSTDSANIDNPSQKLDQKLELQQPVIEQNQDVPETQPSVDATESSAKNTKPTSILSTAEKNDQQKKKKRVNFVDSSETEASSIDKAAALGTVKPPPPTTGNESDFDFSSGSEAPPKSA